ncbi:MAG: hypothetical protein NBKEAIPA_03691 [Nitrospirae bacterium]|nr:hypothetical protein [Nitrospirota bacterium]
MGGDDLQHVDGMLSEIGTEQPTVRRSLVADDMKTAAGGQGGKNRAISQVCAQGRDGRKLQRFLWVQLLRDRQGVVHEVAMGDGHTLGLTGRAGGKDHIGQGVR